VETHATHITQTHSINIKVVCGFLNKFTIIGLYHNAFDSFFNVALFLSGKSFPVTIMPDHCSICKEAGFIQQVPTAGFLIIVNEKGKCILVCYLLN